MMMKISTRQIYGKIFLYFFLTVMALAILLPLLWMLSTSFKTEAATYKPSPEWIPHPFTLSAYKNFFGIYSFGGMLANSVITCLSTVIICLACSALAGYGATRFRFKGKRILLSFLLVSQMFPAVMLVVPFYALLSKVHMTNNLFGLVIVYSATNVAFSTWMLMSYFKTVPIELDEAARVDGAGSFRIFSSVILPLVLPGLAAVAMYVLFHAWNEYMYSSVLVSKDRLKTITVGIISLNSQDQVKWNDLMAASTISSIPLVVLFVCFQRYFIEGMTGGAVKG